MTIRKTLYLHIGQHKTGTSTLQNFLWRNRQWLESAGVLYPEVGLCGPTHASFALSLPGERQSVLAEMFRNAAVDRNGTYLPYAGKSAHSLYSELGRQIADTSCPVIVLSSECFMEWVDPSLVHSMLSDHCDCDIKVLLLLRRQDQWIQSVFNQVVKDPGLRFSGRLMDLPQAQMLDYESVVFQWATAFGKDNVRVFPYQSLSRYDAGVVGLISEVIGIEPTHNSQLPSFEERNVSLSGEQLRVLHVLNRRDISCECFQRVLAYFIRENEKGKGIDRANTWLGYEQGCALYDQYREGNHRIAQEFIGCDVLFLEPEPSEYRKLASLEAGDVFGLVTKALEAAS